MSKRANPTVIGAFVIGAVFLFFAALLIFGGAELWSERERYMIYFRESVNGLNIGAPVKMRGVQIGKVAEIRLIFDQETKQPLTQVIVEIQKGHVQLVGKKRPLHYPLEELIQAGLRAQLKLQSLVTGQLYVDIDFRPETPVKLVGRYNETLEEIPAIPSSQEEIENTITSLVKQIKELPLQELFAKLDSTLTHINAVVSQPEFEELAPHLDTLLVNLDTSITHLDENLRISKRTLTHIDKALPALATQSEATLKQARQALAQAETAFRALQQSMGPQAPLTTEAQFTLQALQEAARELRVLSETLQTHPEALLQGKGGNP
ncbi:paraquat-inducible protein B [Methylomarinovum tepidoasis]|uniref:Paraquat-inducible protein B n=1 Tax=Methylomarinovum tepidoasis TaxID=2840183 RepID=A0AAU9CKE0_9GAMM|nr:MlaD family protein [Methylomarinovum sp. IN45]BCX89901.1 paraquat-inducible protein B [Methylomarinovum sp. IN45]